MVTLQFETFLCLSLEDSLKEEGTMAEVAKEKLFGELSNRLQSIGGY